MPPKQKQAKKGPAYKPSLAPKDIIPQNIKENPREPRPIKIPESFPQVAQNNEAKTQNIFQQWPTQQVIKAYDFGIHAAERYNDPFNKNIEDYIKNSNIFGWKGFYQIASLRSHVPNEAQQPIQSDQEPYTKSLENFQYVELNKQKQQQEPHESSYVVIQTYKRQQNEEQMQKRKKQEAEKAQKAAKDKKKGKKQQPKQQGPLQVNDVKMANIKIKKNMIKQGIWIGSQLQIIKERQIVDVNTSEPIWKKIYPQENGVPIINKSGKYWVKLYYMGKQVKIEVDDRIPINCQVKQMLPTSTKLNQKWTLILTKALLKLIVKINPVDSIVGNGLIFYALTGMISEKISLNDFNRWDEIQQYLSNLHYQKKSIIVSCFAEPGKQTKSPSNYIRNPTQLKNFILLQNSTIKKQPVNIEKRTRRFSNQELKTLMEQDKMHQFDETYMNNDVINGYAYCVNDFFNNDNFNMVFAKRKTQKQIKLRFEYSEMSKVSLNNKGREEKLEHRKKKKQIKQKLAQQEKKKLQLISKPAIKYYFVKLLADLKIHCEYSEEQILLAKKCVLNKLIQPPNYDFPLEKQQNKSTKSISMIKSKEQYEISPSLNDFGSIVNAQQLLQRKDEGIWIKDEDLLATFHYIQILYNPNMFQNKSIISMPKKGENIFSYDESKQILLIQKKGILNQQEANLKNQEIVGKQNHKINLIFGYLWEKSKWDTLCNSYCMLQKFNFQNFITTNNNVVLKNTLGSKMLTLNNQNTIFKIYTVSKGNSCYFISSNSNFKLLSIADYLTQYQNYSKKSFNIQYAPIQAKTYSSLMRLKVSSENENTLLVKLASNTISQQMLKILSFKVIAISKENHKNYTLQDNQGVITQPYETSLLVYEYSRIQISPQFNYYIVLEAYPNENMIDGSLQVVVLSKQALNIDNLEQVQPVKYVQKYQPNKYGLIFRERIFTNNNNNISIYVKVVSGEEGQALATDKKGAKKGGKEEAVIQIIEKPLSQNRTINLFVIKNKEPIYNIYGNNEVNISGINLESTKGTQIDYYLQCKFDLTQWPQAQNNSDQTDKIYWVIQMTGQESIAIVRDTYQQEKEKETRKSWEDQQPGRAQKAKKARKKFLLQLKQDNKEQLTEQQKQFLYAPRLTKKQQLQQDKKNEQKKGGKGSKKDDKKAGKDKKQQIVEQKQQQRVPPKSIDNHMNEIKQFLTTLENCQVIYQSLDDDTQANIRSEEQIRGIKQNAIRAQEDRTARLIRNIQNRETMKIKQKQKKETLQIFFTQKKADFKQKWSKYIQWRSQNVQKEKSKVQKQKNLVDIINQQKPTINEVDLKKLITQYRDIEGSNPLIADVADMVRKNIKISVMTQKINTLLVGWEVDQLKNISQQIETQKIVGIQQQILKNMKQMLQQAEKNPAIVQQKQNQAKKGKKGSKK